MSWKKRILKTLKWTGIVLLSFIVLLILFLNLHPVFGGSPDNDSVQKIIASPNWNGKKFVNVVPTVLSPGVESEYNVSLWDFFFPREGKNPEHPLPTKKFDKANIPQDSITWMGHSTVLIKTADTTILTDPVFHRASPIPLGGKPFDVEHELTIEDLPSIDVVVISHDHYDHLDYEAFKSLASKVQTFYVPLGVKAHLQQWGVSEQDIVELDWYEESSAGAINLTFAPSRHFSGRGLTDQYSTLWGSWIITSPTLNVYFSGDTGYFEEFKSIGRNYGPFDIAFVDSGAYDHSWGQIHHLPEQAVQATIDLQSQVLLPIGWSKFDLAFHPWDEPVIRVTTEAKKRNVTVATPLIGQTFTLNVIPQEQWWEEVS